MSSFEDNSKCTMPDQIFAVVLKIANYFHLKNLSKLNFLFLSDWIQDWLFRELLYVDFQALEFFYRPNESLQK